MFGEKEIYGNFEKTLDTKGRVLLPSATGAEIGDKLFLMTYTNGVKVIAKRKVQDIVELIDKRIEALGFQNNKEINELKAARDAIYDSIIREVTVDANKRINTHNLFGKTKDIVVVGHKDYVVLKKR